MMSSQIIRYAGTFQFHDREQLERALVRARARFDENRELDAGSLRCFVMREQTVTINLAFPAEERQRDAAAEVLAALSVEALDGHVTATIGDVAVEHYTVAVWR